MKTYSTVQVAKLVGVSWSTLHRWIESQKIKAPELQSFGGVQIRAWTDDDLEAAKRYKAEHYWKKPGRKDRKPAKSARGK